MKIFIYLCINVFILLNINSQINDFGEFVRKNCSYSNDSFKIFANFKTDSIYFEFKNQTDTVQYLTNSFLTGSNFFVIIENCHLAYESIASWRTYPDVIKVDPGDYKVFGFSLNFFREVISVKNKKLEFVWINKGNLVAKYLLILNEDD